MENGLTFRFEADALQDLVKNLDPGTKDHVWVTFFLQVIEIPQNDGTKKKEVVMRAKAESYKGPASSTPSGSKVGCPVPPCALDLEKEQSDDCRNLVEEIVKSNKN